MVITVILGKLRWVLNVSNCLRAMSVIKDDFLHARNVDIHQWKVPLPKWVTLMKIRSPEKTVKINTHFPWYTYAYTVYIYIYRSHRTNILYLPYVIATNNYIRKNGSCVSSFVGFHRLRFLATSITYDSKCIHTNLRTLIAILIISFTSNTKYVSLWPIASSKSLWLPSVQRWHRCMGAVADQACQSPSIGFVDALP